MRECDNSKIHLSNNSLLSICLLIILDTLLLVLVPSLHCNTLLHFTTLHQAKIKHIDAGCNLILNGVKSDEVMASLLTDINK